uniref:NADH-ubiquinone oxidoreductase chain 4L n=1 Tax=Indotyphlops braminus TaxID=51846 RepID=A9X4G0_9SAUR|nr:NADH dehydrogenase subunit 4L [Indotyphlops braminus]ABC55925.1 NADH dehydrogenase subunit 4L [Indotyphlops braminus]
MPLTQELLIITFLLSTTSLALQHNHLVYALLCIEAMVLALFMIILTCTTTTMNSTGLPTPIILLTLAACEASVGLSLVIATIRTKGNDLMKNLNLL